MFRRFEVWSWIGYFVFLELFILEQQIFLFSLLACCIYREKGVWLLSFGFVWSRTVFILFITCHGPINSFIVDFPSFTIDRQTPLPPQLLSNCLWKFFPVLEFSVQCLNNVIKIIFYWSSSLQRKSKIKSSSIPQNQEILRYYSKRNAVTI